MIALLAQIFIGWPAILSSLMLSVVGTVRRDARWLLAGGILCAGFAWYLSRWPDPLFRSLGYALPFLHFGGGFAVGRGAPRVAWALLVPHALIALYLAVIVLGQ